MEYDRDGELLIRDLCPEDAPVLTREEIAQGWDADEEKYRTRLRDAAAGKCTALAAQYRGEPVGYINVYWEPLGGPFARDGIPEIVDFGVLEKVRRLGIGSRLMDTAEALAARRSDRVYLGVGLHSGYGSAQRMYVKRGYIPDGGGVWYGSGVCQPYGACRNDDDLVLYLSKELKEERQ